MELTSRQNEIVAIVKERGPITGDEIARELNISRSTIRSDLTILTMIEILGARPKVGYYYSMENKDNGLKKKIDTILVKDTMSVPVVMDENTSVYDVIVGLFLENVSSIFISQNGVLSGVVSRKDLLRTTLGKMDLSVTPVGLIMTRMPNIIYVKEDDNILDAAIKIFEHKIDSLPVVRKSKSGLKCVGRFTKTNITRIFVDLVREDF
ncbi:helix-turn-helix transcriptional regulator [Peptoniphilus indolicus]|uniref:CBS domain protein n=2 Tax=Peptoniphilus indolicus TaxID=33030 RepID=G4D4J8_9FIRM|nr:helix-turn-helix transcriptional regulator [Peptoniphilus indolicus]EGY79545.1 CBS domain protein [Peptoniphilus indolicus ATCC 29427]SUB76016.1 Control catabolite protein of gluconeogenesis [Peptoniphilus indolicus]